LTLQQLEYFLAAYRRGSFSGAAEDLHLAQPSLSEQVRRLEAELGVPLFTRVGRGLTPTEAGETLRPHAERTLAAAEAARESVVAVRELRGGIATFGTWGTARYYPGTDIVAEFRRRHPDVRVRLIGQNSSEVVDAVRSGEIEAGMVALPIDDRGLDVQPIMRDEIVYASADPGRVRRAMTIEGLARAPLILSDASYGSDDPTRRQLNDLAQRAGVTIEPQIDVEDVEAALELAARGMGDTIVARGMLLALGRRTPRRLGWVPFEEPIYDQFAFIARHGARLSPASREFLRLAQERLAALAETLETRPPRRRRPGG
jgi:DNA-binding transcriptional LysR family regulator